MEFEAIFLFLKSYWRFFVVGSLVVAVFLAGYHTRTILYEAEKSKELTEAQDIAKHLQAERDIIATTYEQYRSKSQAQITSINQKWNLYAKTATDCPLSSNAISLLQGAATSINTDPR